MIINYCRTELGSAITRQASGNETLNVHVALEEPYVTRCVSPAPRYDRKTVYLRYLIVPKDFPTFASRLPPILR